MFPAVVSDAPVEGAWEGMGRLSEAGATSDMHESKIEMH
jgi:hypothetical protein